MKNIKITSSYGTCCDCGKPATYKVTVGIDSFKVCNLCLVNFNRFMYTWLGSVQ